MFNISLKAGEKKISYKPFSLIIKYLIDEKKLENNLLNLEKVLNIRLSKIQIKNFLSKDGEQLRAAKHDGKPDEIIISKVTIDEKLTTDYFRNQLAGVIQQLEKESVRNLHVFLPDYDPFKILFDSREYFYQCFVEGILLGNYSFNDYKSVKKEKKDLSVYFYADDDAAVKKAITAAQRVIAGVSFTRDLQNEPAITLTPGTLAERIEQLFAATEVKVKVFDDKEIKKRKMNALYSVGMGSDNPPRMIILEYNGAKSNDGKKNKTRLNHVCLVGKGITFDSGGISIKPSEKMGEMKADMSGAAVVAGTIYAAMKNKLKINITGIIAAAENMPSGKSFRPGDIISASNGKTIEIEDTDAEGRVVLADALVYASAQKPDLIIDLATLTGHCVVALGESVAGLFTKDEALSKKLYDTGMKTYERLWPLPMWDDFSEAIKSDVADIKNYGGRWGGATHAAKFLENFVDKKISWAHLDIAGPAIANNSSNYSKKYMTGFGVRLLSEYLKSI